MGFENQYYRVKLNSDGDVSSIFDKGIGRELLSAPARLGDLLYDLEIPGSGRRARGIWIGTSEQAAPKALIRLRPGTGPHR